MVQFNYDKHERKQQMSEFKLEHTVGGKLLKELETVLRDCIVAPNSWLPEDFHDKIRGGRTLARLEQICDKRDGRTEHRKLKEIKKENVENYRQQFAENESFEYNGHVDEMQLHRNEMAFCDAHPAIEIDDDDRLEG